MKYATHKKIFLSIFSLLLIITLSGCFLFGVKGIFEGSSYQIVKLEIDNKVMLSPQELSNQAKEQMGGNQNSDVSQNYMEMPKYTNRIDDINSVFEQLKQRNQQDDDSDNEIGTPIATLANLNIRATFNLDQTQGMIYGTTGCNDYTAKFFWQDTTKIVVSGVASTRKVCTPKEVANFQNTFIRNFDGIYVVTKLKNRKGYVLNNGRMRIYVK